MEDEKKSMTFASKDILWVVFAIGLFVIAMSLRFIWGEGGHMVDRGAFQRWLTIVAAIVFGFALGWLLYPRRPKWPFNEK